MSGLEQNYDEPFEHPTLSEFIQHRIEVLGSESPQIGKLMRYKERIQGVPERKLGDVLDEDELDEIRKLLDLKKVEYHLKDSHWSVQFWVSTEIIDQLYRN